jgi:hypothetical protein
MRRIITTTVVSFGALLGLVAFSATPALAGSAWWHLSSNPRPAYLHALGLHGVDAVQDVTVTGEVGKAFQLAAIPLSQSAECVEFEACENAKGEFAEKTFHVGESAAELQVRLEEMGGYGPGSVTVTEGPEGPVSPGGTITSTYKLTFAGPLAEQPVELINTEVNALLILLEGRNLATVSSSQVVAGQAGRPDGTIVASAFNVGDTGARECVRVPAGGKFKDAGCSEAAEPGHEEYEQEPVKLVDRLPVGLRAVSVYGGEVSAGEARLTRIPCKLEGEPARVVVCPLTGPGIPFGIVVQPFQAIEVRIGVVVEPAAHTRELNEVSVSGGSAQPASARHPITISSVPVPFGVENYELHPENEGGGVDMQAGSHPFQTSFTVTQNQLGQTNTATSGLTTDSPAGGSPRDVYDNFPAGLIGNPQPFARCTSAQFLGKPNECPASSVVGVAFTTVNEPAHDGIITFADPVFNLEPSAGEPARFGFLPDGRETPVYIGASVRTGGDYGITAPVNDITQAITFLSSTVTIWGVPGASAHNETRDGCLLAAERQQYPACQPLAETSPPPFFELPTQCTGAPLQSSIEEDSWEDPGDFAAHPADLTGPPGGFIAASGEDDRIAMTFAHSMPTLDGCNHLPFEPSIEVKPDAPDASSATGLTVNVKVPQEESLNANGLGEADIRNTTVTLPAGVTINAAGGDGLQACPNNLIGYQEQGSNPPGELRFTPRLPGSIPAIQAGEPAGFEPGIDFCSNASKIGTARIKTPILKHDLEGAVYLAPQEANPFGSLIAMYIVVEDPATGLLLKLPGKVELGEGENGLALGQIRTTFLNTPQAPAEEVELHFFGGERAPLATPSRCGAYTTTTSMTPWSAPESGAPAAPSSTFDITSGPNGAPCPGSSLPFKPTATAGSTNLQAGEFSPFTLSFTRHDGEQNVQSVEATLPPGLSGMLSNIELCPEPQANEGACPESSLIGTTTVSVGVGGHPFTVTGGRDYLTGPYNGTGGCTVGSPGCAPFGLVFEVPAKAGPFDLAHTAKSHPACDCVLVRGKVEINPTTSALRITSDPPGSPDAIPTSLEGIPLEIQDVNATTTRSDFQFNPTNCDKMQLTGTLYSSEGSTDAVSAPYQVTNCAALKFEPKFAVSTSGKISRENGASLTAKVTYPKVPQGTDADIAKVKVELPKQLSSRLTTLQKACTDKQFEANPAGCPPESKIGYAVVHTPLLPVPLQGPAIFVSHGGEAFPSLTMVLQGDNVTIDLVGATFIKNGITSTTFKTVPDQPFSTFELKLPEGKYSALADHESPCTQKLTMPTEFIGQNGAEIHETTKIAVTGCHKVKKTSHKKKKRRTHRGHRRKK